MAGVSVQSLLEPEAGLALTVVAGRAGLLRKIGGARIQKPGLALTGFTQHVHAERMQVLGLTEIAYLRSLDHDAQERGAQSLGALRPCVVVVTRGLEIPPVLPSALEQHGVALLSTPLMSSVFINRVQKLLELPQPVYRHHRLILGEDGKRLAKRDQAATLRALRESGKSPADVRAMVGL